MRSFQPSRSLRLLLHSLTRALNSALRVAVLELVGGQAGDDVVAVGQQPADEADGERREGGGEEPSARRVVRRC